ncbi:MAG TPA: CPBP family intramembrane glutamic endopeptidase [Thermoanaerobaculia bacterium]
MNEERSREPLDRRDWLFILACVVITAISCVVIAYWFSSAFPEVSLEFRYDSRTSLRLAAGVAASQRFDTRGMKHTVVFDSDDAARIFLERSLGLKRANDVARREVRLWYWRHRWFRPLQEEELNVDVAPTGEIVSMSHRIPESQRMPAVDPATARGIADAFLARAGATNLELISQSERQLPARVQRIFTWRSRSIRPAGAEYRHTITVDGNIVSSYDQRLKVPEEWLRNYRELRSKNSAAGNVDLIFLVATMLAALAVFISRLRRGDLRIRFLLGIGVIAFLLTAGSNLNSFSAALADYDTTTSYAAFVGRFFFLGVLMSGIGSAMLLIVVCGAGEVLYRERMPQHLAIPRLWTPRSLTSKRVFRSIILGYTMVAFFIGYQTVFYVIAEKFGAWAPAEIPYDNTLMTTPMPWLAILFAGFFPALSEEFISRAFSIPLFERLFRSRVLAIVLAAYIWGFGHSTYPNQPFYIRGLEVGSAGVAIGILLQAFGLLPLLVWHFTVDALYTALMPLRSGNPYYVLSAGVAAMIFTIPLIASVVLYVRNRGFVPDGDLSNATLPVSPPRAVVAQEGPVPLPEAVRLDRRLMITCAMAVAIAVVLVIRRPASPDDVIDYRTTAEQAKQIATAHMRALQQPIPAKVAALPVSAFRSWDPGSPREEGGSPGGFDETAATYMVRHGLTVDRLVAIMRTDVPTATWMVRFFTPMQKTEYFVEVDPRTRRVAGYHKYADERAPGARLERDAALAIAMPAFARYDGPASAFTLKEALTFQQPNRRDWLFHFEQKQPLAGQAVRRVAIRVMGADVTQFATTVKVPDEVYREARRQTFANIVLLIIRIIGAVAALALVVSGFIMTTRRGLPLWRRATRVALLLAIVPILRVLSGSEMRLFTYNTTTSWDTFVLNATTNAVRDAGMQILLIVVAVAAIFATRPYATALLSREGRARFGRHAVVAALTAAGLLVAGREILRLVANHFPAVASVSEVAVPDSVVVKAPAIIDFGQSIAGAIIFSAAAAVYAISAASWKRRWAAPLVTIAIIFCVTIDSTATPQELPMTLISSAALAVLAWVIARYVLDANPLAWLLAAFTTSILEAGAGMVQNHRIDLQVQAGVLFAVAAATLIWAAWDYGTASERFMTAHASGD